MNAPAKPFAFSYSKLKNYETCPQRHYQVDVLKNFNDESEALTHGNNVHKALADYVSKGTDLGPFLEYKSWADRVKGGQYDQLLVEQQYAIKADFSPTSWFGKEAWYRGIADVVKIAGGGTVALAVDWKTGKITEDSVQLALMAQCLFSHFPKLQFVRTEFVWLKEDATTREDFQRSDMEKLWVGLMPRVLALKEAYETKAYPPKPGFLCQRYCPVKSCDYNGKRS